MIKHVVLTGGPCGGKTSAMSYLQENLPGLGWNVLVVPEAATLLISGGVDIVSLSQDQDKFVKFQHRVLTIQRTMREQFTELALTVGSEKTVILYDRAELDNLAYVDSESFEEVLEKTHSRSSGEVMHLYDGVIHLSTAAGSSAYTLENNAARTEDDEFALELDRKTQSAWLGHSHYRIVGNYPNFDEKLKAIYFAVLSFLGEPEPVEVEQKWVLEDFDLDLSTLEPVDITQTYLNPLESGVERRLRSRTYRGHTEYFLTEKRDREEGVRYELESPVSSDRYWELMMDSDPQRRTILKRRYCFNSNGQSYELDEYIQPPVGYVLEAELSRVGDEVSLPEGFSGDNVTGDKSWSNYKLALEHH